MKKKYEAIFIEKNSGKNLVVINQEKYKLLNSTEKLELLLTVKNWVREQIIKLSE